MKTANKRPSAKIISLIISAILIVGSAVYLKYFSPAARGSDGVLGYEQNSSTSTADLVTQALQNELLRPPTPDNAFSNPNFAPGDNLTDRFSKATFATYMSLQNVGVNDDASSQSVIETMLNQASTIQNPDKYTISNIKTFTPKDKQAIRAYGNAFSQIIQDAFTDVVKNQKNYKDLDNFGDLYEKIASDLSSLPAPKELAGAELQMANYYYNISQDYRTINKYEDDPLKSLLAIKEINSIDQEKSPKVYEIFAKYFKENGILFTKDEAGYGWTGVISN